MWRQTIKTNLYCQGATQLLAFNFKLFYIEGVEGQKFF